MPTFVPAPARPTLPVLSATFSSVSAHQDEEARGAGDALVHHLDPGVGAGGLTAAGGFGRLGSTAGVVSRAASAACSGARQTDPPRPAAARRRCRGVRSAPPAGSRAVPASEAV